MVKRHFSWGEFSQKWTSFQEDGEAKDGEAKDGEAKDGEAKDGEAKDGEAKDGEAKDGETKAVPSKKLTGKEKVREALKARQPEHSLWNGACGEEIWQEKVLFRCARTCT